MQQHFRADPSIPEKPDFAWLVEGGEMADRIRAADWAGSPLGPAQLWPAALRVAINMMLASPFPMFVAWGEDYPYIYNDACIPIVGDRHPQALGQPFAQLWPEVWDMLGPLLDQARDGHACHTENAHVRLLRDGQMRDAWFNFAYSPLRDEYGTTRGVLSVAIETTGIVVAADRQRFHAEIDEGVRHLVDPGAIMAVAARLLGERLGAARCGYGEIDEEHNLMSVVCEWQGGPLPDVEASYGMDIFMPAALAALRAGHAMFVEDAETSDCLSSAGREAYRAIGACSSLFVPLVKDDRLVALLYASDAVPRIWSAADEMTIRDVGERTWASVERARAEAAARAGERELRALADALPVLISTVDRNERYAFNNRVYEEWFGLPPDAIIGRHLSKVLGDVAYAELKPMIDRAMAGEALTAERLVDYPSGARHVKIDYVPRRNAAGHADGYYALVQDIGERIRAETALRDSERRLAAVLESVTDGFYAIDAQERFTVFNRASEVFFGIDRASVIGKPIWTVFPHARGTDLERLFAQVIAEQRPIAIETRSAARPHRSVEVRAAPKSGGGIAVAFTDITDRKKAEQHRELLVNELNHRVKNTLAVVQSLALQSFTGRDDITAARQAFDGRLSALAAAHGVLTDENWTGASLAVVARAALAACDPDRFSIAGPDVNMPAKTAVAMTLALHELATNAMKYGALSVPDGHVTIDWSIDGQPDDARLRFRWREEGGPVVTPPSRTGFGSRMLQRGLAGELSGDVSIDYAAEGVICTIDAPLPRAD